VGYAPREVSCIVFSSVRCNAVTDQACFRNCKFILFTNTLLATRACMSFRWLRLEEILLRSVIPARRGNVFSVSHVQKTQRRERVVFSGLECQGYADEWYPLGRYFCPPVWYPPGMCRFVSFPSAATALDQRAIRRVSEKSTAPVWHGILCIRVRTARAISRATPTSPTRRYAPGRRPLPVGALSGLWRAECG